MNKRAMYHPQIYENLIWAAEWISLINNKKSNGSNTRPCGTLHVMDFVFDMLWFTSTHGYLFER